MRIKSYRKYFLPVEESILEVCAINNRVREISIMELGFTSHITFAEIRVGEIRATQISVLQVGVAEAGVL